jgi:hypothetical protein
MVRSGTRDRRRRVVRVGDEHQLGVRGHRARHRLEVDAVVLQHDHHADAACGLHDHRVHDERRVWHHGLVTRPEERVDDQLDQLVRSVPEHDVLRRHAVALGERLAQVVAAAVRVAVQVRQRLEDRLLHALRRRQRVLVRRELDRVVHAELPLQLLDGLAGLVRRDAQDVIVGERLPLHLKDSL